MLCQHSTDERKPLPEDQVYDNLVRLHSDSPKWHRFIFGLHEWDERSQKGHVYSVHLRRWGIIQRKEVLLDVCSVFPGEATIKIVLLSCYLPLRTHTCHALVAFLVMRQESPAHPHLHYVQVLLMLGCHLLVIYH